MSRRPDGILRGVATSSLVLLAVSACALAGDQESGPGSVDYSALARAATPEEIALWDIDVRGDGLGLPDGQGSVADGEDIYIGQCASCHGDFGEGDGRQPALIGGEGTLTDERPLKTVGSFWPYAGTLYDYVYRAMPFGDAQSLSADETYAVVAYVLYLNHIIDDDAVLDKAAFKVIQLPNRSGFVRDSRPDTHTVAPCMSDCLVDVSIISRAQGLDVTPD